MMKNKATVPIIIFLSVLFLISASSINASQVDDGCSSYNQKVRPDLVKKEQRKSLVETEYGKISAADISDGIRGPYRLQFFTLEPNSLFLPVFLHAHMVFYVQTGSGELSWTDDDDLKKVDIRTGDLYRLKPGSVFYVHSNLEPQGQKLRFYAMFANADEDLYEPSIGAYSRISDMITGFDGKVLQAAFKVPEEVVEQLANATNPPPIVHVSPKNKTTQWDWESQFLRALLGSRGPVFDINSKKKNKPFNILDAKPDIENCNGWTVSVNKKKLHALKSSHIGVFMVNLTKGSMMGPHWNPKATEVSVVLQGRGMIRIACSSIMKDAGCRSVRFKVKEGDVFAVPRFHPMAQISFNNESFVFMGFTTTVKKYRPLFMAGKRSVLQVLDKSILSASLNVTNSTIDQILASQEKSIILDCTSCAEEEEMKMEKDRQKQEEEEKRKREEEAKRKEEKEARKRDEKAKKKEEKRRREEEKRRKEEERKKQEEEKRRREEEERERLPESEEEAARAREKEEEAGGEAETEPEAEIEPEEESKRGRVEQQQKVNKGTERLRILNFAKFMV